MTGAVGNEVEVALVAALASAVTGRMHPMYLPENVTYPAIRYSCIVTEPQNTMCGESDLDNCRYRIDIFDKDWDSILALRRAVRTAMDTFAFPALCVGDFDVPEPEQKLFHKALDFSIWAKKPE